jgi:hypothetical protein
MNSKFKVGDILRTNKYLRIKCCKIVDISPYTGYYIVKIMELNGWEDSIETRSPFRIGGLKEFMHDENLGDYYVDKSYMLKELIDEL